MDCTIALAQADPVLRSLHRKIYPPIYGMFEELRHFSPGDPVRAHDTSIERIGVPSRSCASSNLFGIDPDE